MRKRRFFTKLVGFLVLVGYWVLTAASVAFSSVLKCDLKALAVEAPFFGRVAAWMINVSPVVLPLATIGVAVLGYFLKFRGSNKIDATIKRLLDDFRKNALPQDDAELDHRVTIFKHYSFHVSFRSLFSWGARSPFSGWLVPYERAGEFTLRSKATFLAPKDEPDNAEGVVGIVFSTKKCVYISTLPKLKADSPEAHIQKYAEETRVSESWVKSKLKAKKKVELPRSFWGIPIEVDGEIWGVFLIDSRTTKLPNDLSESVLPYSQCISKLLSNR